MLAKELVKKEIDNKLEWIEENKGYKDAQQKIEMIGELNLWKLLCEYEEYYGVHDKQDDSANPRVRVRG